MRNANTNRGRVINLAEQRQFRDIAARYAGEHALGSRKIEIGAGATDSSGYIKIEERIPDMGAGTRVVVEHYSVNPDKGEEPKYIQKDFPTDKHGNKQLITSPQRLLQTEIEDDQRMDFGDKLEAFTKADFDDILDLVLELESQ